MSINKAMCTCKAAAIDPVVKVVVGKVGYVLLGSDLVSAVVDEVKTLQRLPKCRDRRTQKQENGDKKQV